jgi:4-hydroxybenzoate polyprenyltransferase
MTTETTFAGRAITLPPLLEAMRPYQWPKNLIVFAGFVFSAGHAWKATDADTWWPLLWRSAALFVIWCAASSAVYLVNDIRDRDVDRLHPRKQHRAIARGALGVGTARGAAIALLVVAIPAAVALDQLAGVILAGYAAMMILYSWGLKQIAILDVIILCGGVVARAVGAPWPSTWT